MLNVRTMLFAGAASAALATPTWAQQTQQSAGQESSTVSEVVVTAQKREERLLEVPLPVQSLSAESIEESGATKVSDLVRQIPGASVVQSTTPGFETIQIRGIASGTTGDALVGYYIDETPFGIPNLQLTPPARLLDLERVEIVRGPSGTLYGQSAMGGTIKLITAKPDSTEFSGRAEGEVSQTSGGGTNYNADVVLNVPLIRDRLAARVSVGHEFISGFAEAPEFGEENINDFRGTNARLTLGWTPTDDLSFTGFAWRIRNDNDFSSNLTRDVPLVRSRVTVPFSTPAIVGTGGRRGFNDVDADIYSVTANWSLPFGELVANTSYLDHRLKLLSPTLTLSVNESDFQTTSSTQEIRLSSPGDAAFTWLVGAFRRDASIQSDLFVYTQTPPAGPKNSIINTFSTINTVSYSLFGEASISLFDGRLEPLVGVAFFRDERGVDRIDRGTLEPSTALLNYESVNPRFNVKYKPAENGTIYFNAAKGFRSGGFQTPAQAAAANVLLGLPAGTIGPVVTPDSLWTYELGTRWELLTRSLLVEAAIYRTDWTDVLVGFASPAVSSLANGGDAQINGADFGVSWRTPIEDLTLQAVGSINEAKFVRVNGNLSVGTNIRVGGPMPNVPRTTLTLVADYERDLPWNDMRAVFYGAYSFRDNQADAATKNLRSGEVNDLTLRAGIESDRWLLEAFVTNALDDDDPAVRTGTTLQIIYPRRIGVRLGTNF